MPTLPDGAVDDDGLSGADAEQVERAHRGLHRHRQRGGAREVQRRRHRARSSPAAPARRRRRRRRRRRTRPRRPRRRVTPSPSSSTTPATSWPVRLGRSPPIAPLRTFQSIGLTPAARTATRIWPGPGCGIRELHELQHLGSAELAELDRLHRCASGLTVTATQLGSVSPRRAPGPERTPRRASVLGQPAGERVLLAGVKAAEQREAATHRLGAVAEARPRPRRSCAERSEDAQRGVPGERAEAHDHPRGARAARARGPGRAGRCRARPGSACWPAARSGPRRATQQSRSASPSSRVTDVGWLA